LIVGGAISFFAIDNRKLVIVILMVVLASAGGIGMYRVYKKLPVLPFAISSSANAN